MAWASICDKTEMRTWVSEDERVVISRAAGTFSRLVVRLNQHGPGGLEWPFDTPVFQCDPSTPDPLLVEFTEPITAFRALGTLEPGQPGLVAAYTKFADWPYESGDIAEAHMPYFHRKDRVGDRWGAIVRVEFCVIDKLTKPERLPNNGIFGIAWPKAEVPDGS